MYHVYMVWRSVDFFRVFENRANETGKLWLDWNLTVARERINGDEHRNTKKCKEIFPGWTIVFYVNLFLFVSADSKILFQLRVLIPDDIE